MRSHNQWYFKLPICFIAICFTCHTFAQTPDLDIEKSLAKLPEDKSYIILTPEVEQLLIQRIGSDSLCKAHWQKIKHAADSFCKAPDFRRVLEGRRLLDESRSAVNRVVALSLAWRLTNDDKYLNRVSKDLLDIAAFENWNPDHFLDVAEMAFAVAIGLDWCKTKLPPGTIKIAQQALKKHLDYSWNNNPNWNWWVKADNNWNQVCHGGIVAAALALAKVEPDLAAKTIARAADNFSKAMHAYAPDGAYIEGPSYWVYGTSYTLLTINMLQASLGTDFGLSKEPGFLESAMYRLAVVGPSRQSFNYFDSGNKGLNEEVLCNLAWFAQHSGDKIYLPHAAWKQFLASTESGGRHTAFGLIWRCQFSEKKESVLPPVWVGKGKNPVVVLRGNKESFLAAKGGSGSLHHSNLDGGSFVFEKEGIRWAIDPGNQPYHLLEKEMGMELWDKKQTSRRWALMSKNNFWHNTLTVNQALHLVEGDAPLVWVNKQSAQFDLTSLFGKTISKATRTFSFDVSKAGLTIKDSLTCAPSAKTISWNWLTTAQIELTKTGAVLSQDGKQLRLNIKAPKQARFNIVSGNPPLLPYDIKIPNLKKLSLDIEVQQNQSVVIEVEAK